MLMQSQDILEKKHKINTGFWLYALSIINVACSDPDFVSGLCLWTFWLLK